MKKLSSVYRVSSWYALYKAIFVPCLRPALIKLLPSIFFNFFYSQHLAAFLPGKIPVAKADHKLDEKIPFVSSWVTIYLDFVHFWIRMLSFILRKYGRKVYKQAAGFIYSMGRLYAYAAEVYKKNLSTTKRPFYIKSPRFLLIHLADPHLMCIPSLHVMIVIHTYTVFEKIAKDFGDEENLKTHILELKQGALAISQAILYVKQHSVNCIPAALYAMTCYTPELFPPQTAENFINQLFSAAPVSQIMKNIRVHPAASPGTKLPDSDIQEIKSYLLSLYNKFLLEKETSTHWTQPLLNFLKLMS